MATPFMLYLPSEIEIVYPIFNDKDNSFPFLNQAFGNVHKISFYMGSSAER